MKILVTGANGQLGVDVVNLLSNHHEVFGYNRTQLDVTDLDDCLSITRGIRPDIVIHCAAYTQVDLAEREVDQAFLVNSTGIRNMVVAAEEIGATIVYFSTDYVFDGLSEAPYQVEDQTNPQSVYGKSKLLGEQHVQKLSSKYFIIRTSWLYGEHGNNFVRTMLRLSRGRDELRVVSDQQGSPTYTVDLVHFLIELIETQYYGIYHVSNAGNCSWYEFSKAIFEECNIAMSVIPCSTAEYQSAAPRPMFSVFDHSAIVTNGFLPLRPWQDALHEFLHNIVKKVNSNNTLR